MSIFVDTSAFLAVMNANDEEHRRAKEFWQQLLSSPEQIVCTNYIVVETFTLLQRHYGVDVARKFQENIYPVLTIEWVDDLYHQAGAATLLATPRRTLSLVDCASFEVMRLLGIKRVFCFDDQFLEQGFECLPVDDEAAP